MLKGGAVVEFIEKVLGLRVSRKPWENLQKMQLISEKMLFLF